MMPESTSPVPAVASRSSPAFGDQDPSARLGDDRRRALQQHDGAGGGGQLPCGGDAVRTGRRPASRLNSPSWGVSTVGAPPAAQERGAPSDDQASANSPSPSTTTGRAARPRRRAALVAVASARPRPGPTTRAWKRSSSSSTSARPSVGGSVDRTTSVGTAGSWPTPGRGRAARSRRRPAGRRGRPGGRRRSCPGSRRPTHTAALPLVGVGRPRPAATPADVGRARRGGRDARRGVEPDVDHLDLAGQRRGRAGTAGPASSAAKVTVRVAGSTPARGRAGQPVDAARDVDGQHRRAAGDSGARPRRRGTRCRRRRRSPGRPRGSAGGAAAASNDARPRTRRRGQRRRPRPARRRRCCPCRRPRTTRRPYVPAEHRARRHRATAAPARSISTSTGSGAAASIAAISSGVTIGIMIGAQARAATTSRRSRAGRGVGERQVPACRRPARPARPAAWPRHDERRPRPLSARSTSTSRKPNAPSPTPSAFITASLAANRAASDGDRVGLSARRRRSSPP